MNPNLAAPAEVLLVEDDRAAARLVKDALKDSSVALRLSVVRDGEQALALLRRAGVYAEAPRPNLVLLDLNLPRKDGFAVLGEVRADPLLKYLPVVVLTTSHSATDILRSYDLGANCYIVKPRELLQVRSILRMTVEFWLIAVVVPSL